MYKRKLIIPLPLIWPAKFKVKTSASMRVLKTFLVEDDVNFSYLKILSFGNRIIHRYGFENSAATKEETITSSQYFAKKRYIDITRHSLEKTRYFLVFQKRTVDFDVYEGYLTGLAILKQNVAEPMCDTMTPPYLIGARDITAELKYSSYNLSGTNSFVKP